MVGHTKASRMLVDRVTNDWLGAGTEELWPAATKVGVYMNCVGRGYADAGGRL
jgi:hypothetical protein